ncbi:MAG: class I SAM-dependent methyltransferase [Alphaproteobacteria bacterium]|nr:class I SAM-dependent methyltransferase [Alphaproteobacteria bacterium]
MSSVLPPTYDRVGRHGLSPDVTHDETARFNFLTNLNVHIGQKIFPGTKLAFESRVAPAFDKAHGRALRDQCEVRDAMKCDPLYQFWAATRRSTMEMRQQSGRHVVLRQLGKMSAKAAALNAGKNTLVLDPRVTPPDYLAQVDNHWMPGSYYSEATPGDVLSGAAYEAGLFVTTAGSMSARGDGAGRALVRYLAEKFPDFKPRRILDLGAGVGVNTLPIVQAFPDAEVVAVDAAAPTLRYAHARSQAMGYGNVQFIQASADDLPFPANSFDWIQTTMFWHETSVATVRAGLKKIHEMLRPGGLTLHIEQPNFAADTPLWDRFTRDWDAWFNNEPFWRKLHMMNVFDEMAAAGFGRDRLFDGATEADIEPGMYQDWASTLSRHKPELKRADDAANDGARKGEFWYLFGAWK